MNTVTYKGNKIVAEFIEMRIQLNDDGETLIEQSSINFYPSRFLGDNDGRIQLKPTKLSGFHVAPEKIAQLANLLAEIFVIPENLRQLAEQPILSSQPLEIDGKPWSANEG